MKIVKEEQWIPADGIELEEAANIAVRSSSNILVIAGPGAGKTELLAQKAVYLFSTNQCTYPRKILAISFKKDSAGNLKERVIQRCGTEITSRFVSLTFDAFAKGLLDQFRYALPYGNIPEKHYLVNDDKVIDAAFQVSGYEPVNEHPYKTKKFYEETLASVGLPLQGDNLGERVWKNLLTGFEEYNACLNFKMISMLALLIIKTNPKIKKALQITYSHVFLDEFQDTTTLQYDLVKECFLSSDCLITAVGDAKQRIMLWAGASKTIFKDFHKDFHAECEQLIMNHRSAPRLVNLQKSMYDSLQENNHQIIPSKKWKPEDGEIILYIAENNQHEEDTLVKDIEQRISLKIAPNEICILCKQKVKDYTNNLIERLAKKSIRARIEDEYQNLNKEPIVEIILSILKLSVERKCPREWTSLMDFMEQLYGWSNDYVSNDQYRKIQEEIDTFLNEISNHRLHEKDDVEHLVTRIIEFLNATKIKACFPAYRQGINLQKNCSEFVRLFSKELQFAKFDILAAIDGFLGLNSIPIMTIHKSKGLEYSVVYFVGLEDSAFWNFKNQPEENRCAFFVALSRAKHSVIFTYCKHREGFKFPEQKHHVINEFFQLLQQPNMATTMLV